MTWKLANKLPTLSMHYKTMPDPKITLPEGLLPNLSGPTQKIDTSLAMISGMNFWDWSRHLTVNITSVVCKIRGRHTNFCDN